MIYIVCSIFIFLLFCLQYRNGCRNKEKFFYLGAFVFFSLFALRSPYVGGDTLAYCDFYMGHPSMYGYLNQPPEIEYGFHYLCKILSPIFHSEFAFIFISSLISIVPFLLLVKKYSIYSNLSILYILCSNFLIMVINLETNIRQNIATGYIMMALLLILEKPIVKRKLYVILLFIVLALLTHNTSFITIPLLLLLYFIPFNKWGSIIFILASFVIDLFFVDYVTQALFALQSYVMPVDQLSQMASYLDTTRDTGVTGIAGVFMVSFPIVYWSIINVWYADKTELNNIFIKCLVVGTGVCVMCHSFGMSYRMLYCFQLLGYCYIPKAMQTNKKFFMLNTFALLYLLYRSIVFISNVSVDSSSHIIPYTFIFE